MVNVAVSDEQMFCVEDPPTCRNNVTCSELSNGFSCACGDEYSGTNCGKTSLSLVALRLYLTDSMSLVVLSSDVTVDLGFVVKRH